MENTESNRNAVVNLLKTNNVSVRFLKADNTERVMLATLRPEAIKHYVFQKKAEEPDKVQITNDYCTVWDLEKKAWRTFRFETIISYDIVA